MVLESSDTHGPMKKMVGQCVGYFLLIFALEFKLFRLIKYKYLPGVDIELVKVTSETQSTEQPNDDVIAEEQRVKNTPVQELCKENSLVIKGVSKVYGGTMLAVDNVNVALADNECFGLLGQNGAGKTTIFKMLIGDVGMTEGDIYFKCQDVKTSLNSILKHVGYCPQHNALDSVLTGRETLYFYGRLRGVPEEHLERVSRQLFKHLTIPPYAAEKMTIEYSGGTRRKLCVGISLMGNTDFILLDEPTAGVDPAARRHIWDLFRDIRSVGKTIIMTSHSMEECEALCTRLAIMVTGSCRCIGSLQQLKSKFAQGLAIVVKMTSPAVTKEERDPFLNFIKESFPNFVVTENTPEYVHFVVPGQVIKWSAVFETLETAKEKFNIANYSVQQTTLEQIFLKFVTGAKPPICGKCLMKNFCLNCCE